MLKFTDMFNHSPLLRTTWRGHANISRVKSLTAASVLVGFDPKIHQALPTFKGKKQPVSVSNCEIKESSFSPELEILVRKSSDLHKSPLVDVSQLVQRTLELFGDRL